MHLQPEKENKKIKLLAALLLMLTFVNSASAKKVEPVFERVAIYRTNYVFSYIKTPLKSRKEAYVAQQVLFDCENKGFQILSMQMYNSRNKQIFEDNAFEAQDVIDHKKFTPIEKNSGAEIWYNKACPAKR